MIGICPELSTALADGTDWERFTHESISRGEPLIPGLGRFLRETASSKSSSSVLILGENHTPGNYALYPRIFAKIEKIQPGTDCLFVESPSSLTQELARYRNGEITDFEYFTKEAEALRSPLPILHRFLENHGFLKIPFDEAIKRDWKLIAVDADFFGPRADRAHTIEGMNRRNEAMASGIAASLRAETCKRGVLVVGLDHLLGNGAGLVGIHEALLKAEVGTQSIGFIDRNRPKKCPSCGKEIADLEHPLFVRSQALPQAIRDLTLEFPGENDEIGATRIQAGGLGAWVLF